MSNGIGKILSIKELVYNNLKSRIINGELKPGSRLLEADLSQELEISRAPIREALNILEKDGFVTIVPRKGAIVSEITEEDIFSIWEYRMQLEPYAARVAVSKIKEEELDELEEEIRYVNDHPGEFTRYMQSDLELHDLIAKYLDNSFMQATLDNIRAHSLRIRWMDEYNRDGVRQQEIPKAVNAEHLEIIHALKTRDEEKAGQAVKVHVINSTCRIMKACGLEFTEDQKQRMKRIREMN